MSWEEVIKAKRDKGFRKITQFLEDNGYAVVGETEGSKHLSIKVRKLEDKDDENAQTVETIISQQTQKQPSGGRLKMVLRDIKNLFQGRGRRGQGEFKLSENYKEESWTDILKNDAGIMLFIQLLIDADLPLQMGRKLDTKIKEMYPVGKSTTTRPKRRISDDKSTASFNNKVKGMSVPKRARIASKLASIYETTDDTSLKPGQRGELPPRSRTLQEQFENITDDELEMLVKYMLHLIETA
jgi:hypothetical protein